MKQVEMFGFTSAPKGTVRSADDVWILMEKWGWHDLYWEAYAKMNIHDIGFFTVDGVFLISRVPIPDVDSIKGLKIRASGDTALALEAVGAATVYFPGAEVYSGLATGLVDAVTYSSPATNYSMGFHEVAQYWILPYLSACSLNQIMANMDFWNSLPDNDKALFETGTAAAAYHTNRLAWHGRQYNRTF